MNVGDDKITAQSGVKIQILDEHGFTTTTYTYHKKDTNRGFETYGWYKNATRIKPATANDVFFPAGTGMYFGGKTGYSIQTSGEVLTTEQTFDLIDGNKLIANPYPTPIKLTEFIMDVGEDKITAQSGVKIQILDEHGFTTSTYTYHKKDTNRGFETDGWYKNATRIKPTNDVTFQPGESMYFGGKVGYTVTFPAPKLSGEEAE